MDIQSKIQAARDAGYSDSEIQAFMQQNGINPSVPQVQTASQPQAKSNGLLDFLLPTIGGIAGGVGGAALGGATTLGAGAPVGLIAGGAAGQAGGRALANLLEGKNVEEGVGGEAVGGAIGGGLGFGAGKLVGGVLGDIGENFITKGLNLTKGMINRLTQSNGEPVAQTLMNHGLSGVDAEGLGEGVNKLQNAFDSIAKSDTPIDNSVFAKHSANALDLLNNSSVPSKQSLAKQVQMALENVGSKMANGKVSNLADLNAERQAFDSATADSQFGSSDWGANRYVGDILRKTVQDTADQAGLVGENGQTVKQIGQSLQKLRNIQDIALNRQGMGAGAGGVLSLSNLLLGEAGGQAGGLLGLNPLISGIGAIGVRSASSNPLIASLLSKGATSTGNAISKIGPLTGVLGGGLVGSSIVGTNQTNNQKEQDISHTSSIPQGVNYSVDNSGNFNLKPLGNASDRIPQTYPYENYLKDLQASGGNPIKMQQIQDAYNASQTQAQDYAKSHALPPGEEDFMFRANQTNTNMNELRQLVNKQGNSNVLQAIANDNPLIQQAKVKLDPTGDYATMLAILTNLRGMSVRAIEGGRPSNFDLNVLNSMPTPGDTKTVALRKLDHAQQLLAQQYEQNYPFVGLNTYANYGVNQVQQANQQNPQSVPPTVLQQVLGLPAQ